MFPPRGERPLQNSSCAEADCDRLSVMAHEVFIAIPATKKAGTIAGTKMYFEVM